MARVHIAGRECNDSRPVAALLTAASWLLGQLPDKVREDQRKALVQTLGQAENLVIEVHVKPAIVLIRDGDRALVKIPAKVV
jgi:hypothetical protein